MAAISPVINHQRTGGEGQSPAERLRLAGSKAAAMSVVYEWLCSLLLVWSSRHHYNVRLSFIESLLTRLLVSEPPSRKLECRSDDYNFTMRLLPLTGQCLSFRYDTANISVAVNR